MTEPKLGIKVRNSQEDTSWSVVSLDDDFVGVSGPGPCRSMKYISRSEFESTWVEVDTVELKKELTLLREFYKTSAKIFCIGTCGKAIPVLQDSDYGQRSHIGEWVCPPCHKKICGVDVTNWHDCKALL